MTYQHVRPLVAFIVVVAICCLIMTRSVLLAGDDSAGTASEPGRASASGPSVQPLPSLSPLAGTTAGTSVGTSAGPAPLPSASTTAPQALVPASPSPGKPRTHPTTQVRGPLVNLAHSTPPTVLHTTASQLVAQLRVQGAQLQQQAADLEKRSSSQAGDLAGASRDLAAQAMALSTQGDALVVQADKLTMLASGFGSGAGAVLSAQMSALADQVSDLVNQAAGLTSQVSDLADQVQALPPEPAVTDTPSPESRGSDPSPSVLSGADSAPAANTAAAVAGVGEPSVVPGA